MLINLYHGSVGRRDTVFAGDGAPGGIQLRRRDEGPSCIAVGQHLLAARI